MKAEARKKLEAAVAGAYKGVFYDNNFDYLCNPAYDDHHLGESLKRICVHEAARLSMSAANTARHYITKRTCAASG